MGSRIRENPDRIFEGFFEVAAPTGPENGPWILQKYPETFNDMETLKSLPLFTYPCSFTSNTVQHFSFVLTNIDSKWTFGFCRHSNKASTALCILSYLPWHELFYKVLNKVSEITHTLEGTDLIKFLDTLYNCEVPKAGYNLQVLFPENSKLNFDHPCPDHNKLPSIPENRNLTEFYNAIDTSNMMVIFASMLNERRIVITSSKLSRLSACVQAANSLIYPMSWQHIFIPIVPTHLMDYLSAPMPFLVGVPQVLLEQAKYVDLSDVVVLNADENKIQTPFDDLQSMPTEVVSVLKRRLKHPTVGLGDGVPRAFLIALATLIGGYTDGLDIQPGHKITFNEHDFVSSRSPALQPYVQRMLNLQIFQQFIDERLEMLNSGQEMSGEFEQEVNAVAERSSSKMKTQYKDWLSSMKKEGGALLKTVRNKTNPAVKTAYKHVKDRGKRAYREMRSKFQEVQIKDDSEVNAHGTHSAPSSPTAPKPRPVTMHGFKSSKSSKSYVRRSEFHSVSSANKMFKSDQ